MVTPKTSPSCKGAFTLVELLVVIGIVIVLAALLFPAVDNVRKNASTAPCMSHQKQIVSAILAKTTDNQGRLPDVAIDTGGAEKDLWYAVIADYMNFSTNKFIGREVMRCPAAPKKRNDFCYGLNFTPGPWTVFSKLAQNPANGEGNVNYTGSRRFVEISPSTILIADTYDPVNPGSAVFYHPKGAWPVDSDKDGDGVKDSASLLGGQRKFNCIEPRHANGKAFIGVAADGSAKLLTIREWAETPKYWGP